MPDGEISTASSYIQQDYMSVEYRELRQECYGNRRGQIRQQIRRSYLELIIALSFELQASAATNIGQQASASKRQLFDDVMSNTTAIFKIPGKPKILPLQHATPLI